MKTFTSMLRLSAAACAAIAIVGCSSTPSSTTDSAQKAVESAVPAVSSIVSYIPPMSVSVGETVTFDVKYAASENQDVVVMLQNRSNNYKGHGSTRISVSPGEGIVSASVNVDPDAPAGNDYQWQVLITATGGNWNEKLHYKSIKDVEVK